MSEPDAPTRLDFAPLDPEPTGQAESLAWSGEQEEAEDYPFSPDSAPTVVVEARSGTPVVIAAVILSAVA